MQRKLWSVQTMGCYQHWKEMGSEAKERRAGALNTCHCMKEASWKRLRSVWLQLCDTLGGSKGPVAARGQRRGWWPGGAEGFRAGKLPCVTLWWWTRITRVQTHRTNTTKSDPDGDWTPVVVTCQCRFMSCNKCLIWWNIDSGEGHMCGGTGGTWENPIPSDPFFSEPKIALVNRVY